MLKRILAIALGVLLGSVLAVGMTRLAMTFGFWPMGEINRSAGYLREVIDLVNDEYVEPDKVAIDELTRSAMEGMVDRLDPHSSFLPARDYTNLQEEMNNEFGGIGVQVEFRNDRVVVIAPITGTPGARAGILRGDEIIEVDGESMIGATMNHVVSTLRGKPGTSVDIVFNRPSSDELVKVNVTREVIQVESVRLVRMLPEGIGYVQVTQFSERTGDEFAAALDLLRSQGMQGLVIDLRNNPGGLLSQAAAVAEPFFDRGELIVYTQGRRPDDREELRARGTARRVQVPVAVLINAGSASAAEIVAGALKDTQRAVLVGERSFGKGSVQSIFRLRNGEGLRLTTARYFTPGGEVIHGRGVSPDVELVMTPAEDRKVALQAARDDMDDPAAFAERFGFEPIADRQLDAAVAVLRAANLVGGREVLASAAGNTPTS